MLARHLSVLSFSSARHSVDRGTSRDARRVRNGIWPSKSLRACTTFVYSNGIYNGTIIYARQRVPRPLDGAGVTSCSSWGEGERNRGFTASLGDTQKKRPVIPIKKYRAANCEYLWRYDVARPLPETNTVIVFDENAPLVDFSEIYIF